MKRYIITAISSVIMVCAVSAAVYAGSALQDEYLASADRLRVRAAVETDATKKEEYIKQAEKFEQMADNLDTGEPESMSQDRDDSEQGFDQEFDENGDPIGQDRTKWEQDKIRRDYERARNVQEKVDKLTCASCRDEGSGGSFGE